MVSLPIAGHFPDLPAQQNEPKPKNKLALLYCQAPRKGGGHCNRPCPPGLGRCAFHELENI
jgi:hypothetical protein